MDAVIVGAWLDNAIKIATFAGVVLTMFLSWRNSKKINRVDGKVDVVQDNVLLIEKATNSMKDALVASTGTAAHAAGKEEGRVEGEQKAAVLAQGQLPSKEGNKP